MALRRGAIALLLALLALFAALAVSGSVWCAFGATVSDAGNSIKAATDWLAPTSSARAIGRAGGGVAGFVKPGGTYNVYVSAADAGNPASGVSTVTANVSSLTSGQTAAALSSGSFTFAAVGYGLRSSTLTAGSGLANGSYGYSLTLTDSAGNVRTESGYTVTVDGTAPSASEIQTTNKSGNTAGRPEAGDTVVFTFSEPPDPTTILSGWTGASTSTVVRIENNAATSGNDRLQVYNATNTTLLPLGSVDLGRTDYVTANLTFGATGTASTMALSSSTVTVTLGTQSAAGTTAASTGSLVWTPSSTVTDRAGNAMSTTSRTESGSADKDF